MTIFIITWFISGLVAAITTRLIDKNKVELWLHLLVTSFGYLSFFLVFITLIFPWLKDKFIALMNWEI